MGNDPGLGPAIYAVATFDTKGEELGYVVRRLKDAGAAVRTVDVSAKHAPGIAPDVARERVAACHPGGARSALGIADRGEAVREMSVALARFLLAEYEAGRLAGVIGLGGSGGTALIAPGLQALPVGVPKLLVSTVASGNTRPYVDSSDITLMYSVVDVAGLNRVSKQILGNAAHAIAGMVANQTAVAADDRAAIGMTMFGVTTPCVEAVRRTLEPDFDCLVFHATGTGGRAMEKLVASGMIAGVLDVTTTEVADELVGGVLSAGPERLDALVRAQIPLVLSVGALDMVNFGARDTVPEAFADRLFHVHNPQVTLMRTTPEENARFARWIADKLNRAAGPWTMCLPEGGVSALDAPGAPFHDPRADAALFDGLTAHLRCDATHHLERVPGHINDAAFANALVAAFRELVARAGSRGA